MQAAMAKQAPQKGFDPRFWTALINGERAVSGSDGKKIGKWISELSWAGVKPDGKLNESKLNERSYETCAPVIDNLKAAFSRIKPGTDKNLKTVVTFYQTALAKLKKLLVAKSFKMNPKLVAQIPKRGLNPKFWEELAGDTSAIRPGDMQKAKKALLTLNKLGVEANGSVTRPRLAQNTTAADVNIWIGHVHKALEELNAAQSKIDKRCKQCTVAFSTYQVLRKTVVKEIGCYKVELEKHYLSIAWRVDKEAVLAAADPEMFLKRISHEKRKIEVLFKKAEKCTSANPLSKDQLDELKKYLKLLEDIKKCLDEAELDLKKLNPEYKRMCRNCCDPDNRKWVPEAYKLAWHKAGDAYGASHELKKQSAELLKRSEKVRVKLGL